VADEAEAVAEFALSVADEAAAVALVPAATASTKSAK